MKKLNFIAIIGISIFVLSACNTGTGNSATSSPEMGKSKPDQEKQANSAPSQVSSWNYADTVDPMTDKKGYQAFNISTNKAEFDFPYAGGSELTMHIRNEGKWNEVFFVIDKGQVLTGGDFDNHNCGVKFDDGKMIQYPTSGTSDGSADCAFISGTGDFVTRLKKSKKIRVQLEFHDHGREIFEFNTEGFKWDH